MTIAPPLAVRPVTLTGQHVRLDPLSLDHLELLEPWALDASLWRWAPRMIDSRDGLETFVR